jgi:hypothetical protein
MIDTHQEQKIKRFMHDAVMSSGVYSVLLHSFLKPRKDADVYTLAASRIAIDLLNDAWKELEKIKGQSEREEQKLEQVGL